MGNLSRNRSFISLWHIESIHLKSPSKITFIVDSPKLDVLSQNMCVGDAMTKLKISWRAQNNFYDSQSHDTKHVVVQISSREHENQLKEDIACTHVFASRFFFLLTMHRHEYEILLWVDTKILSQNLYFHRDFDHFLYSLGLVFFFTSCPISTMLLDWVSHLLLFISLSRHFHKLLDLRSQLYRKLEERKRRNFLIEPRIAQNSE